MREPVTKVNVLLVEDRRLMFEGLTAMLSESSTSGCRASSTPPPVKPVSTAEMYRAVPQKMAGLT